VIDPASNSFRVRLELPNPEAALPPGLRCKVDFELGAPQAAGKPAPGPKAQAPAPSGIKPAVAQVSGK
jgi:multidrug efflux pump subunit AcrA (membrane-fusion protein)